MSSRLEVILRKNLQSLITKRYGYNHIIQYARGDKQNPWHIFATSSKDIYKVASYKDATQLPFLYRAGSADINTEKEIIVWIRLQPNPIKSELTSYLSSVFSLSKVEAERLFYRALPDYLSDDELAQVHSVEEKLNFSSENMKELDAALTYLTGIGSMYEGNFDSYTMNYMSTLIDGLLEERFLIA